MRSPRSDRVERWLVIATHIPADGPDGGMVRYATEVLQHLAQDVTVELHVLARADAVARVRGVTVGRSVVHASPFRSVALRSLHELLLRGRFDVVLGTKHLIPLGRRATTRVLVVHDTMLFDLPRDFPLMKRVMLRRPFRMSLSHADLVVCVSHATRRHLVRRFPTVAPRAVVVPLAPTASLRTVPAERPPGLPDGPFGLVVGDASPRKNVDFAVRVWKRVVQRVPDAFLVHVGQEGKGPDDHVLRALGFVSDGQLRWCYENAAVVLCPSHLEGFGLPAVEALAAGAPVITSTDEALSEASGGSSLHLPAISRDDEQTWCDAVIAALEGGRASPPASPRLRTWSDVTAELRESVASSRSGQRERLRVLHVTQPVVAGVPVLVRQAIAAQVEAGWEVHLAAPDPESVTDDLLPPGQLHEWSAVREPTRGVLREARALDRVIREVRPHVVHLHSSKASFVGRLVVRGRIPTIVQPHAWSFLHGGSCVRAAATLWERCAARWATVVISGSESERQTGLTAGVIADHVVVRNAVRVTSPVPAPRHNRETEGQAETGTGPVVVCVGRLAHQKGQDLLLRAWPLVRAAVPAARLLLVGDGPDRGQLESQASEGVRFLGHQEDVTPWLEAADIVVQPSRWETLSLSLLEAMASGCCVVTSDHPSMIEALGTPRRHGGPVVDASDTENFAQAIAVRLLDPRLRGQEGSANAERIRQHFSAQEWSAGILSVTVGCLTAGRAA